MRGILLGLFIAQMAFRYSLKYLNIRSLQKQGGGVPAELEGEIDEAVLRKTRGYTVDKARLGLLQSLFGSLLIILFIFGGLIDRYDAAISSSGLPFIPSGLLFFLLLTWISTLLSLPFSLYGTFKIENRYGFNRMTGRLWLSDLSKSLLLSTVLNLLVVAVFLALVEGSPRLWWLWAWLFFLLIGILLMYISPYVIEPLFNKYAPVREEGLEEGIRILMEKAGIRVGRILVVDASRRSRHTNAYFTGIGRLKRIVLYDTLLKSLSGDEVLAVLAHEAGHWKKRHILRRLVTIEALSLAALFVAWALTEGDLLPRLFELEAGSFYAKLLLLGFAGNLFLFPFTPLASYLSRRHEEEADRFACRLIERRDDLERALVKIHKDNLDNLHPHPLYVAFYYAHLPLLHRLKKIETY